VTGEVKSLFGDSSFDKRAPNVLIVEDNDSDYLLLERHIKKLLASTRCQRAENRAQLQAALTETWDLVVTDFHLPDIEGDELLATIAAAQRHTPCLLLSGSTNELDNIVAPQNVFGKLEKGDFAALRDALLGKWR
jgi:CheY-like chemotaxis protein